MQRFASSAPEAMEYRRVPAVSGFAILLAACALLLMGCVAPRQTVSSPEPKPAVFNQQPQRTTTRHSPKHVALRCPLCGGQLTTVGKLGDEGRKLSKNEFLWNSSMSGNVLSRRHDPFCTRCWFSYSTMFEEWVRESSQPDSFRRPLSTVIRDFPLSVPDEAFYSQRVKDGKVTEEVFFWCSNTPAILAGIEAYCSEHDLSLEISPHASQKVHITATTKPNGPDVTNAKADRANLKKAFPKAFSKN